MPWDQMAKKERGDQGDLSHTKSKYVETKYKSYTFWEEKKIRQRPREGLD